MWREYGFVATRGDDLRRLAGRAPDAWIRALEQPDLSGVFELWSPARDALPLFWQYLHESLEAVVLIDAPGLMMGYFFKDWVFKDWVDPPEDEFDSGMTLCPLPVSDAALVAFERRVGPLPRSLREFWRRHATTNLKNGSLLAWINEDDSHDRPYDGSSRILPGDLLAIADSWRSVVLALPRDPTSNGWSDEVVRVWRGEEVGTFYKGSTVDRLLVDWQSTGYVSKKGETPP